MVCGSVDVSFTFIYVLGTSSVFLLDDELDLKSSSALETASDP